MHLRTRVTVMLTSAALAAAAVLPPVAGSAPIDDKRRQAAELQRQIDANDHEVVALSERYNGAQYRVSQARAAITEAEQRMKAAETERRKIRSALARRAAQVYRSAGSSTPFAQINVASVNEMASRSKYASIAAQRDDRLIAKLRNVKEDLDIRRTELERQRAAAESEATAAQAARAQIAVKNREARALQSQVQGEIAEIMRKQEAARVAARASAARVAAQAAARPPARSTSRPAPAPVNFVDVPAPNAGAAAAVAYAKAQVGKGYRFATAGPDTFDCSGLTSAAWARGGVSLVRYSGAQYQQTIRIGRGDLQPGDLIFYGTNASDHVSMYVGGGMVVSASNPRVGVRYVPMYGSPMGYGRVRA